MMEEEENDGGQAAATTLAHDQEEDGNERPVPAEQNGASWEKAVDTLCDVLSRDFGRIEDADKKGRLADAVHRVAQIMEQVGYDTAHLHELHREFKMTDRDAQQGNLEAMEIELEAAAEESMKMEVEPPKAHISRGDYAAEGSKEPQGQGEASVRMGVREKQNTAVEEGACPKIKNKKKIKKELPQMLRLISSDGHVFIIREDVAFVSPTIVAMMSGPALGNGECHLRMPSHVLAILARYLHYKKNNPYTIWDELDPPPSFDVPSSLCIEASHAADFLGLICGNLSEAVEVNDLLSVYVLLSRGTADLEEVRNDFTPLEWAAQMGYSEIAEKLLEAGASFRERDGSSPLNYACGNNHVVIVKHLVAYGADINGYIEYDGCTPLLRATMAEAIDTVRCLLEMGADPRVTTTEGNCALTVSWDADIMRLLIAHGADVNHRSGDQMTPLMHAAMYDEIDGVRCLLDEGADHRLTDRKGLTPMHYARSRGVVRLLIARGADINAQMDDGATPLIYAASRSAIKALRFLLDAGADPRLTTKDGKNALDLARNPRRGAAKPAIIRLLEEHLNRH